MKKLAAVIHVMAGMGLLAVACAPDSDERLNRGPAPAVNRPGTKPQNPRT